MEARIGDHVVLEGARVGHGRRRGEVLEVLRGTTGDRYRVRWEQDDHETVLAPGPWRRVEPRANIAARFAALNQCAGAGNSNFRARGHPSDAAMFAANRRHEDRHAHEVKPLSTVPWFRGTRD